VYLDISTPSRRSGAWRLPSRWRSSSGSASCGRFRSSCSRSFFLALYYSTIEFAIGAALAVADLILVTGINPASGDPAAALLEGLLLVAFGILVRRVRHQLEGESSERAVLLSDLSQRNQTCRS